MMYTTVDEGINGRSISCREFAGKDPGLHCALNVRNPIRTVEIVYRGSIPAVARITTPEEAEHAAYTPNSFSILRNNTIPRAPDIFPTQYNTRYSSVLHLLKRTYFRSTYQYIHLHYF